MGEALGLKPPLSQAAFHEFKKRHIGLLRSDTAKEARPGGLVEGVVSTGSALIQKSLTRERQLIELLESPHNGSLPIAWVYLFKIVSKPSCWVFICIYIGVTCACSLEEHADEERGMCYAPQGWKFKDYFPSILNTLATFMLVFYTSQSYARVSSIFAVALDCRHQLQNIVTMAVGSCGNKEDSREPLMTLWRVANSAHLTCYTAMWNTYYAGVHNVEDKYGLDNFIRPIGEAFGDLDAGMFTKEEEAEMVAIFKAYPAAPNLVHQLWTARMYRVVQELHDAKLTSIAWPAWQALLAGYINAMQKLRGFTGHRVPRMYAFCVKLAIYCTIAIDAAILGTEVGVAFQEAHRDAQVWDHAEAIAVVCSIMLVLVVILVLVVLEIVHEFENPFADDACDFPAFTWATGSCYETLSIVETATDGDSTINILPHKSFRTPATTAGGAAPPVASLGAVPPTGSLPSRVAQPNASLTACAKDHSSITESAAEKSRADISRLAKAPVPKTTEVYGQIEKFIEGEEEVATRLANSVHHSLSSTSRQKYFHTF